jgi:hypothetical protein
LDPFQLEAVRPVGAIKVLLGVHRAAITLGIVSGLGFALLALLATDAPCGDYIGCTRSEFTPLTATYIGAGIGAIVGSLWLAFMARGLAAVIRLVAGPEITDPVQAPGS